MKKLLFVYALFISSTFARVIVISDIDDTIKKSNSMGGVSQVYHFLKMKSYPLMSLIYQDIQRGNSSDEVSFFYVSAAPDFIYDQDKWLKKKGFPFGQSFLRKSLGDETYAYKMRTIRKILSKVSKDDRLLFFGDNSSHDPKVYLDIIKELRLRDARIFIRDVSTVKTFNLNRSPKINTLAINSFFSERDLLNLGLGLSAATLREITKYSEQQTLVPLYTLNTLKRRMRAKELCHGDCVYAEEMFFDYY